MTKALELSACGPSNPSDLLNLTMVKYYVDDTTGSWWFASGVNTERSYANAGMMALRCVSRNI